MTLSESTATLVHLYTGVFVVLILASLIGQGLKMRAHTDGAKSVVANLNARTNAWWVMVGVLALAMAAGEIGVVALFAFISFQALREFVSLTHTRRGDHRALLWSFFFFLPLQYWLISTHWVGLFMILIPVYGFLLLPISAAIGSDTTRFLERAAKVQWGLMICVYCISHIPALLMLSIPNFDGRQLHLVAFLILVVQSSDVFQYVWGKLMGKRKISPAISPSKTLEGLIGGILTSTALGASLFWLTPFNLWQAALIALTINVMGFFGGFVLSAIKRDRGVKDWGWLIEGHGGMLDRVDSLSFAAPVFFHIVRYWWVP
ncbi:MAG TPA: phosphatidate cytidylyltransferase [Cellvibrionaceae bacterium]|nr:phosphatidate cytidylyltransferase [Cellvibrionaceae bacterium]HMW72077.1 phosphatidate cytidylyltransferase [Cellvibrionaceae bacterium]HMY39323.1 phosphatidate cytidylyltransferase [Marinagarivorans sp.]HNG61177.1 phosphatidate cytidylyltransferase [Cellvibrionaceae bacterium]